MKPSDFRFGFRIVGSTREARRLVDPAAAFAAYARCDDRAECGRESYLSAYHFADDFREHLAATGSTAGFSGPCWSPWLWLDFDADEVSHAQADAGGVVEHLAETFSVDPGGLLLFFSGSKGFHVGLPTALWMPSPSERFHRTSRRFAESLAEAASVAIDSGVYDRVRAFRAPNSRHPKTGLHKRRLTHDELLGPLDAILALAGHPAPFDMPPPIARNDSLAGLWEKAEAEAIEQDAAKAVRRAADNASPALNRATLDFIRDGAMKGDRHRLLFSAAANLGEFGCPPALAHALLSESALDSGLPPSDVCRQVECGLDAVAPRSTPPDSPRSTLDGPDGSIVAEPPLAAIKPEGPPMLLEDPPPLKPLPPRAIGSGSLDSPCRCGSTHYVEIALPEGRSRIDCRECNRFIRFGMWSK